MCTIKEMRFITSLRETLSKIMVLIKLIIKQINNHYCIAMFQYAQDKKTVLINNIREKDTGNGMNLYNSIMTNKKQNLIILERKLSNSPRINKYQSGDLARNNKIIIEIITSMNTKLMCATTIQLLVLLRNAAN